MPSSYTPVLGLVQPNPGELLDQWGGVVNTQLTALIEASIVSVSSQSVTAGDWTLTTTGAGNPNEARSAVLVVTGTPGTTRNIYAPKQTKLYVVVNNSDSMVFLKGGPTSPTTGAFINAGQSALCAWDTTLATPDFVKVAGGGGGATGGGTNEVFFLNGPTVSVDYSVPSGKNAGTFGPVTINSGVTVTVPTGSVWSVV